MLYRSTKVPKLFFKSASRFRCRLYFLRADALRDKQTVIKDELFKRASERRKVADEQNDSGSDSEDFEEFLDWRAKKAL